LGDADDDTDNTLKWVKMSKKKEKELARKRQQDLESMDRMFQGDEYTESSSAPSVILFFYLMFSRAEDLAGLKVSHDFEELNEGENRILTLKDSRILDNEGLILAVILKYSY
jgi:U4/U6.U5 tri-snRNP-associated protein 1